METYKCKSLNFQKLNAGKAAGMVPKICKIFII